MNYFIIKQYSADDKVPPTVVPNQKSLKQDSKRKGYSQLFVFLLEAVHAFALLKWIYIATLKAERTRWK